MLENYVLYQSLFQPVPAITAEEVLESKFHYAWSEPVRVRRIHTSLIVSGGTINYNQPLPPTSIWYRPLNEPVRLPKGLRAWYHPYGSQDTEFVPRANALFGSWYPTLSLPVRLPKGLKAPYHPAFFYHPRTLPPVNLTVTMAALEINSDVALFGVDVFDPEPPVPSQEGASVVIIEVPVADDGSVSIREP